MNKEQLKINYESVIRMLPKDVLLVAVSKTKPVELINEVYHFGQRDFGENKVQELLYKKDLLPKDISWHFIGHLQRNKVKQLIPYTYLIHSVDSELLLKEIDKQAQKIQINVAILLQIHIAKENTKHGFDYQELKSWVQQNNMKQYTHVEFKGLMGMATNTNNSQIIEEEFNSLKIYFDELRPFFTKDFSILSMGMSSDYLMAIKHGSNLVRIGSTLFGER